MPDFAAFEAEFSLQHEGGGYADRLHAAGVPVDHTRYTGMIHGFMQMAGRLEAGRDVLDRIGRWLADLAASTPGYSMIR